MLKKCICHRDLKSANVLVKDDGESACIADFNLAIIYPPESQAEIFTHVSSSTDGTKLSIYYFCFSSFVFMYRLEPLDTCLMNCLKAL